nr:hypothetical protein [Halocatena marina]
MLVREKGKTFSEASGEVQRAIDIFPLLWFESAKYRV